MAETASPLLSGWSNFFIMAGSSAAALVGLMFVVISLIMDRMERRETAHAGISTFSTPTVIHLAVALLISAALLAPWHSLRHPAIVIAVIGLGGVVYIVRVAHRASRLTFYRADVEDWVWYTILPFIAYAIISAGAIALATVPVQALFILAGGVLVLMSIAIRNAWDIVTYLAIQRP